MPLLHAHFGHLLSNTIGILVFGIAAISMQMKDWQTAEAMLLDLKKVNYGENGVVELYLAQVAEDGVGIADTARDAVERTVLFGRVAPFGADDACGWQVVAVKVDDRRKLICAHGATPL